MWKRVGGLQPLDTNQVPTFDGRIPVEVPDCQNMHIHNNDMVDNDKHPIWHDESAARLLSSLKVSLIVIGFSLPLVAFGLVASIPHLDGFSGRSWRSDFNHCDYDGSFTPYNKPIGTMWDMSGIFNITFAWGQMSFQTAKIVDIIWDTALGRGGQAILAYVTYAVSSRYLQLVLQRTSVSYSTFEALAFMPPTAVRTLSLARELLTHRGWLDRMIVAWIVSSSLFVLCFSSFATAIAGYSSTRAAVIETYQGQTVPWQDLKLVQFIIQDAQRLGEPEPIIITSGITCVDQGIVDRDDDDDEDGDGDGDEGPDKEEGTDDVWKYVPPSCTLFWRTVQCKSPSKSSSLI